VVVDLSTGRLLAEHDARQWLPQASTMKLLTAVTAANNHHLRLPHKVTRFEVHQTCTCAGLAIGHRYTFKTLLEGMLLPSGNDAAEALAGSHPRGRDAFYAAMNRTARRLGARDTVARNASGLTAAGSHSSARDLVILLRAALRHRVVRQVLAMPSAQISSVDGRRRHTIWRGTDYVNLYPHSLGKSGYTTPAGNTLVVATRTGGHHIAVAVMHAPYGYVTSDARRLTEWAAENFAGLRKVGRLPFS
jgi:D-alanyl-D-alanine carboxypeptidase (penicillin-binding protein 5/6)